MIDYRLPVSRMRKAMQASGIREMEIYAEGDLDRTHRVPDKRRRGIV
jgi:hypothetical protein